MTIDKRINFRFGGDTMGGPNDKSNKGSSNKGSSNKGSSNKGSSNKGSNNKNFDRPNMRDISGSSLPKNRNKFKSNIPTDQNKKITISTSPMDIREQARLGNVATTIPGGKSFVTYDNPYSSEKFERTRYDNYIDAKNLANRQFEGVNTPSGIINVAGNLLGNAAFNVNKNFFAKNVAGKYGYGYGLEDFQRYMQDRTTGKVGAFGNENMGQNAINLRNPGGDGGGGIMSIEPVQTLDLDTESETIEVPLLEEKGTFNFGTAENPLYYSSVLGELIE